MRTQSKVTIQNKYQPLKLSQIALHKLKTIEKYKKLREKFNEKETLELLEVKRSTFYSWLKKYKQKTTRLENQSRRPLNFRKSKVISHDLVSQILKIRQDNLMFGKEKIRKLLQKQGVFVSSSTIGRVLKGLMRRKKITPIPSLRSKHTIARKNSLKRIHAVRLKKERAKQMGELIQVDHMVLNLYNGLKIKEFRAVCPITRVSTSRIYSSATAKNAKEFLKEMLFEFDFEVKSIQVDGGSEFMAEFEEYCMELGIKLYVLPPRSPKINGKVERANETYRYEFWNIYEIPETIEEVRKLLKEYEYHYNCVRPHQSLNYLTPMEFYYMFREKVA